MNATVKDNPSTRSTKSTSTSNSTSASMRALMKKFGKPPIASELVAARAYELYQERMTSGESGDSVSDWLRAEGELTKGVS